VRRRRRTCGTWRRRSDAGRRRTRPGSGAEDHTQAGQAGEDVGVPVPAKMLGHHLLEPFDLGVQHGDGRDLGGHGRYYPSESALVLHAALLCG
jgi:hypothetical protein